MYVWLWERPGCPGNRIGSSLLRWLKPQTTVKYGPPGKLRAAEVPPVPRSARGHDDTNQADEAAGRRPARGHDPSTLLAAAYLRRFRARYVRLAALAETERPLSHCVVAMSQVVDNLDSAREAAARHAWKEAHAAYAGVDARELTASDLELYGEAAWWQGKLDSAIGLRERAYAAYTSAGDKIGAARMALTLSWDHEGRGEFAVAHGWFASAERLLDGAARVSRAQPARPHPGDQRDVRRG